MVLSWRVEMEAFSWLWSHNFPVSKLELGIAPYDGDTSRS
jgi:hypothetical protein